MCPLISDLKAVKSHLGPLVFLDFSGKTPEDAHKALGSAVKNQVHRILREKLIGLSDEQLNIRIRQVRSCQIHLFERSHASSIHPEIRAALVLYLNCLSSWAEGAGLGDFDLQGQRRLVVDNLPLNPRDLALLLQYDDVGCITGMYRHPDGSISLWHTEEDVESQWGTHFDPLRIMVYQVVDEGIPVKINAFIYPELLPGVAFAWRSDGFIQAVDSLILKKIELNNGGCLANIASWLTLILGSRIEIGEIIKALAPFYNGCAINTVFSQNKNVFAAKCEFAADQIFTSQLDELPGKYLLQANIFSQKENASLLSLEGLKPESRRYFEKRIERTQKMIRNKDKQNPLPDIGMDFFHNLLSSRAGGEWAYANPDVKAYFAVRVSPYKSEIQLGSGPLVRGEHPVVITFEDY